MGTFHGSSSLSKISVYQKSFAIAGLICFPHIKDSWPCCGGHKCQGIELWEGKIVTNNYTEGHVRLHGAHALEVRTQSIRTLITSRDLHAF